MYFFSIRKAGPLYGKAPSERDEAPKSYDDRLAGVLCQVHLLKKIVLIGEGLTSAFGRRFVPSSILTDAKSAFDDGLVQSQRPA